MKRIAILTSLCILVLFSCDNKSELNTENKRLEEENSVVYNQYIELQRDLDSVQNQNIILSTDLSKAKNEISLLKQEVSFLEEELTSESEFSNSELFNYDNKTKRVLKLLKDLHNFNSQFYGPNSFTIYTEQDHDIYSKDSLKLLDEWYLIEFEGNPLTVDLLREKLETFYNDMTVKNIMDDIPRVDLLDVNDNILNTIYSRHSGYILTRWLSSGYDFQTKYLINETQLINKTLHDNTVFYLALTPVVSYDETGKNIIDYNLKKYQVQLEEINNELLFKQIPQIN